MQQEAQRYTGRVRRRSKAGDFAHIQFGDKQLAFAHIRDFVGRPCLRVGTHVEFRLIEEPGKPNPRAVNVTVIASHPEAKNYY